MIIFVRSEIPTKLKIFRPFLFFIILWTVFTAFKTVKKAESFNYKFTKVVIDAGHGGKDPGAMANGVKEKDINLAIALKTGAYIKSNLPGVEVVYTRSTDKFIELIERAEIANQANADLFISIHCNSSPSPAIHGTETYVMGPHKSKENLEVAKRENEVILLENDYLKTYDGFDPRKPETHIILSLYQNAHRKESTELASLLEDQLGNRAGRYSRGVSPAGFIVLFKTAMPSILVETGFITNANEAKFLNSEDGQSLIASAIYRSVKEYKNKLESKSGSITPSRIESETKTTVTPPVKNTEVYENTALKVSFTPPPSEKADNPSLYFKIQLYTSYDNFNINKVNLKNVKEIEIETTDKGIKKYMLPGIFTEYKEAEESQNKMMGYGFNKATVIIFKNNIRQN